MAETRNHWITLADPDGATRRYNLASMTRLGISLRESSWATGVSLEDCYLMPRSKRIILHTYSIWQRGNSGEVTGDQYRVAETDTIAMLYDRTRDERLLPLIPEGRDPVRCNARAEHLALKAELHQLINETLGQPDGHEKRRALKDRYLPLIAEARKRWEAERPDLKWHIAPDGEPCCCTAEDDQYGCGCGHWAHA